MLKETVGASSCGSRLKLNLLLKTTIGAARDAIRKYTLMVAEQGYKQAKKSLKNDLDHPTWFPLPLLKTFNPGSQPSELLKLSDMQENAKLILNEMNMYSELYTQASILNIC